MIEVFCDGERVACHIRNRGAERYVTDSSHMPEAHRQLYAWNNDKFLEWGAEIGGGTLSVPFLLWNNLDMRKAIGTSAAIGFPIALAGCFGYIVNGWNAANLPPYSFGYIYLPGLFGIVIVSMFTAPLGARLAQTLPVPKLKKCFALLLIVVGIRMLLKAL